MDLEKAGEQRESDQRRFRGTSWITTRCCRNFSTFSQSFDVAELVCKARCRTRMALYVEGGWRWCGEDDLVSFKIFSFMSRCSWHCYCPNHGDAIKMTLKTTIKLVSSCHSSSTCKEEYRSKMHFFKNAEMYDNRHIATWPVAVTVESLMFVWCQPPVIRLNNDRVRVRYCVIITFSVITLRTFYKWQTLKWLELANEASVTTSWWPIEWQ